MSNKYAISALKLDDTYVNTLPYNTCSSSAADTAKVVSAGDFSLETGAMVVVKFTVTNSAENPTLNVSDTGARAIYYNSEAVAADYLKANHIYTFVYNGDQWELVEGNAKENVQSDWNETDTTSDAYINNKPNLINGSGAGSIIQKNNFTTTAVGNYASAFGIGGKADGNGSFKTGNANESTGPYSFTEGDSCKATAWNAYAGGYGSQATTQHSYARGEGLRTVAYNQHVVGKFNVKESSAYGNVMPVFTVGYGSSDKDRNDVFNVLRDGRAIVPKTTANPTDAVNVEYLNKCLNEKKDAPAIVAIFHITNKNTQITLKNLPNVAKIDWGDGTVNSMLLHTYAKDAVEPVDQIYICKIYGVPVIGSSAFARCYSLESIVIPDSVTSIDNWAFEYCTSLTSVVIGGSVTSIGYAVFTGCSSLTEVVISEGVTSIGERMFENCHSLTSVVIPDSVTSIGNYAFSGCSKLTSVVISDSVTTIGEHTFNLCRSLTSVDFKNPTPITYTSELHWFTTTAALTYIYVPYGCSEAYKTKWTADGATEDILSKIVESDREAMMSDVNNLKLELDLNLQKSHGDRTISTKPRINDNGEVKEAHAYQKDSIALAYKGQAGMTAEEFAEKYPSGKDDWGHTYEQSFGIAFAEGLETRALGRNSHAQNRATQALANDSSASGVESIAKGINGSNANGFQTQAIGASSFTANYQTKATEQAASAFGMGGEASGKGAFKTGGDSTASGDYSFTEGVNTKAIGNHSHAQNRGTQAIADDSSASGVESIASGINGSNATGYKTQAIGASSFTANDQTKATEHAASAFGIGGEASGEASFKTGKYNITSGAGSFSTGESNVSSRGNTFTEGQECRAEEWNAYAGGYKTHATTRHSFARGEGLRTVALNQTVFGKYNVNDSNEYNGTLPVLTVGYGTSDTDRKDVFNVLRDGRAKVYAAPIDDDDVVRKADLSNIDAEFFNWLYY